MIEQDALLKIESNLKVIKTLVELMIEKGASPDSVEHLRSKSTMVCWPCWLLENEEIPEE